MRNVRRALVLLALFAGSLAIPAGAGATGWLPQSAVPLAPSDVGFDGQGNAVAVGTAFGGASVVQATDSTPGGPWNAAVPLSGSEDSSIGTPRVAVDPAGNAVAIWSAHDDDADHRVVRVARRPSGGAWSAPTTLSADPATAFPVDHSVAIDPQGRATAVWVEFSGGAYVVRSATAPVGGGWSTVDVSNAIGYAREPQVAVDPQGNATVAWWVPDVTGTVVHARHRTAGGSWDEIADLGSGIGVQGPAVAADTHGRVTVVWSASAGGIYRVWASERTTAGAWSDPALDLGEGQGPQVAVDPQGNATAVWTAATPDGAVVHTSRRAAGGLWSAPLPLATSSDAGNVSSPQVAVDSQGNVTAIWGRVLTAGVTAQASRRAAGGDWSTPSDLDLGPVSLSLAPVGGLDPQGHATLLWTGSAASASIGIFDPVAPDLRDLSVPESATVGARVDVSVSAFDISAVETDWDFGDGQTGSGETTNHVYASRGERTVTVRGVDAAGNVSERTRTIRVSPASNPGPGGPGPGDPGPGDPGPGDPGPGNPGPGGRGPSDPGSGQGPDLVAPGLTQFRQSASRWSVRRSRGTRTPVGTTFGFRLDRAATVRLAFEQIASGRRNGKRCVAPTKKNRKQRPCTRYQRRGTLSVTGRAGTNRVAFRGKLGGRTLKPGRYRVLITAGADGRRSKAITMTFTIVR